MKKMYLRRTAVSTLFVLLALSVVSVSAQPFEWNSPQMVLVNASPAHITAIAVDPVTEAVYGIDDAQNIVTITGVEVTDTKDAEIGAITPVVALATNIHGVPYAVSSTTVSSCSTGTCAAIDVQPKLPTQITLDSNAMYKDIAIGKGGKIYVLLESADKQCFLLVGYPPAMTDGVSVSITPVVLNLASKGNWVNATVDPPEGYDAEDILPESVKIVRIQGTGPSGAFDVTTDISKASGAPYSVTGDKLHVKLPRYDKRDPASAQTLAGLLTTLLPSTTAKAAYNLTLSIEGQLESGEFFSGTAPLTVLVPKAKTVKHTK